VLAADAQPDGIDLVAWLAERLVRYKLPKSVRIVDALPKTAVGKVDKNRLRELARGA
jgi:fatty-acyl-CoA synthase